MDYLSLSLSPFLSCLHIKIATIRRGVMYEGEKLRG
jgi:hypothetical protein